MMLVAFLMPALAAEVEVWSYDFAKAEQISGVDGWENGYREDPWYGYEGQQHNYAGPYTDDSDECGNGWGGSCNNYLINPAQEVTDGHYTAGMYTEDDDTVGLVFGFQGPQDYLLLIFCGNSNQASCPVPDTLGQLALVHITEAGPEVLASTQGGYPEGDFTNYSITINDGQIEAATDATRETLTAAMPDERPLTGIGFYAYNSGLAQGYYVLFYEPTIFALDSDEDGLIDDEDNCEDIPNPDQTDQDGDGIGAECDEDDSNGGSGDDSGGNNNGDDSGPSGNDSDPGGNGGNTTKLAGECGACSSSAGGSGALFLLGALALARRRSLIG